MKRQLVTLIATGFYSGYLKPFPGTWGTIPAWLIAYFFIGESWIIMLAAAIICTLVSVWASGNAENYLGHDARKIVIDEWAGMFVTFLFVPAGLANFVLAFFAFRFMDVVKIPPARQAEKLPGGWGVTFDDIVAGIQAGIATQLFLWLIIKLSIRVPFLN